MLFFGGETVFSALQVHFEGQFYSDADLINKKKKNLEIWNKPEKKFESIKHFHKFKNYHFKNFFLKLF